MFTGLCSMLATLGTGEGRCPEALRAGRGGMVVSAVWGGRLEGGTETYVFQSVDRKYFEVKLEARCSYLAVSSCPRFLLSHCRVMSHSAQVRGLPGWVRRLRALS